MDSQSVKIATLPHTDATTDYDGGKKIKRSDNAKGFVLLPKRWVVERTWGWLNWCRRLSKDYEILPETAETFIYVAMIRIMLKRLA
jgi:transposase